MRWMVLALGLMAAPIAAKAEGEVAGEFDYWVLALSWSPTWCALEGDARGSPQCDDGRDHGWTLHGLWPQFDYGWPSYCPTALAPPSRTDTAEMADIMGSAGLAWHQWRKHGVCSGLDPDDYFALSRQAYEAITRPAVIRDLTRAVTLPASVIEEAFLRDNPDLAPDGITITCRAGRIQEARVCLSRDLEPVDCGADVVRDCTMTDALLEAVR